ncbi:MAG: cell division protein FtsL [Paracoccaceae bacterium]
MRTVLYVLSALVVMGLAYWAYNQNYRTHEALKETQKLQREIAQMRETLGVLRAEWAYLNRPDRLRELADLNYDRLGLLPLRPDQFGEIGKVAYPAPELPPILSSVEVVGEREEDLP